MGCRATKPQRINRSETATAFQSALISIFDSNIDELRWLAEAILGDTREVDQCLKVAIGNAMNGGYVASGWHASWIKRCVVREAVNRVCAEIQGIAGRCKSQIRNTTPSPAACEAHYVRSIPAAWIYEVTNALERAAFILHCYLGFSRQDCALLLDCDRSLIEPASMSALQKARENPFVISLGSEVRKASEVAA